MRGAQLRVTPAIGCVFMAAAAVMPAVSATPSHESPAVPEGAAEPRAFVPAGWQAVALASGDLNADGHPDAAIVLAKSRKAGEPAGDDDIFPLVLVLSDADGGLTRSLVTATAVMCAAPGGGGCRSMQGPYFDGARIIAGALEIRHMGGAGRSREIFTHTFRLEAGAWLLVKESRATFDAVRGDTRPHPVAKRKNRLSLRDFDIRKESGL